MPEDTKNKVTDHKPTEPLKKTRTICKSKQPSNVAIAAKIKEISEQPNGMLNHNTEAHNRTDEANHILAEMRHDPAIIERIFRDGVYLSTPEQKHTIGRSKNTPPSMKQSPVLRVVPVVHRRDPRCFV